MKSSDDVSAAALWLLICGALLWSIAALAFSAIREEPGATEGGRNAIAEARVGMGFVMREPWYLRYLAARTALLSVEISAPFYVLYVKEKLPVQAATLRVIIVAAGVAAALSSPIWGRFADLSSRRVLVIGGLMGAATGAAALFMAILPSAFQNPYVYGSIFVLLGFAEARVLLAGAQDVSHRPCRSGRERKIYVAFANTAMGVVTLIFGFLGVLAQIFGIPTLIVVLIVLGLTGAAVSYFLPETSIDQDL